MFFSALNSNMSNTLVDSLPKGTTVEAIVSLSKEKPANTDNKREAFFNNAQLLSDTMEIVPLMYGSLGLEYLTGEDLNADDIDILIPQAFLKERWSEFKSILENDGYTLIDEHEHTFEKNNTHYSYASIEELQSFADIRLSEINILSVDGINFKLLSLPQFLKVYTASSKDGYRKETRGKKDADKIAVIKQHL